MIEVSFFRWHGMVLDLGQRNVCSLLEYTSVCLRDLIVTLDIIVYLGVKVLLLNSWVGARGTEVVILGSTEQKVSELIHSIKVLYLDGPALFTLILPILDHLFILVRRIRSRLIIVSALGPLGPLAPPSPLLRPVVAVVSTSSFAGWMTLLKTCPSAADILGCILLILSV